MSRAAAVRHQVSAHAGACSDVVAVSAPGTPERDYDVWSDTRA
ncbi:MAG TPA: hypothetical protein VFX12_10050 [Vicinamibacterales bacterium]|nr:hypothetical protein [Vicinamibacterales bacterium]